MTRLRIHVPQDLDLSVSLSEKLAEQYAESFRPGRSESFLTAYLRTGVAELFQSPKKIVVACKLRSENLRDRSVRKDQSDRSTHLRRIFSSHFLELVNDRIEVVSG
jgi:hypothetical protein